MHCDSHCVLTLLCASLFLVTGYALLTQWPPFGGVPGETFWETFRPEHLQRKYERKMRSGFAWGTGTNSRRVDGMNVNKHFGFEGVQLSEQEMVATLRLIQSDMIDLADAAGVQIRGRMRFTVEAGVRHQFEFDYRHRGVNGLVRGHIAKCDTEGGWDLFCVVAEKNGG